MPDLRTELTEIGTALGMLGYDDVVSACRARPDVVHNITAEHWKKLQDALEDGSQRSECAVAFDNGRAFAVAADGLRGRPPRRIEWKGAHQTPGFDRIPADLRIDHVYLVSCKYDSRILFNGSPAHLFERLLATRHSAAPKQDWYRTVAPEPYGELYRMVREHLCDTDLPDDAADLKAHHRAVLKTRLKSAWPDAVASLYRTFSDAVSWESARLWQLRMNSVAQQEETFWRLLRLAPAPYFVLGRNGPRTIRLRIGTPWDWRQEFSLRAFDVWPREGAGQPRVEWRATVASRCGADIPVHGHVEVRWSHGRFCGNPEAKVYLDTPHELVPGYYTLQ